MCSVSKCRHSRWMHLIVAACAVGLLGGCFGRAAPNEFLLLKPLAATRRAANANPAAPVIGLGPVHFPLYLDRPQFVVETQPGHLALREDLRWAQDLSANFVDVLAEDLAARVPEARVVVHPWPRTQPVDWKLVVRVQQFHVDASNTALLDARWEVYRPDGLATLGRSRQRVPVIGSTVAALSQAVDRLAAEVAEALRRIPRAGTP